MARAINIKNANYIYTVLVRRKILLPTRRTKKGEEPEELLPFLRQWGLTFPKWCRSWRLNPETAFAEIASLSGPAAVAAMRDFPVYWCQRTAAGPEQVVQSVAKTVWEPDITITFVPNASGLGGPCFCAFCQDDPVMAGFGDTRTSALDFLQKKIWHAKAIRNLAELVIQQSSSS